MTEIETPITLEETLCTTIGTFNSINAPEYGEDAEEEISCVKEKMFNVLKIEKKKEKIRKVDPIDFQLVDIASSQRAFDSETGDDPVIEPILIVWGRVAENDTDLYKCKSIQVTVRGFFPYLYFKINRKPDKHELRDIEIEIEERLSEKLGKNKITPTTVLKIEYLDNKKSVFGYQRDCSKVVKVTLALTSYVVKLRTMIEDGNFNFLGESNFLTYESDLLFTLRWMIDSGCAGGSWLRIDPSNATIPYQKESNCGLEFIIDNKYICCYTIDEMSKHAPLRILSFDIECATDNGKFPDPDKNPVIQIACKTSLVGDTEKKFDRTVCFNLRDSKKLTNSKHEIIDFKDERDLLMAFRNYLVEKIDPDIIIGYNIANFDFPYLIGRANRLKIPKFKELGRIRDIESKVIKQDFQSKAYGTLKNFKTLIDGRLTLDILSVLRRDVKLSSYTLNAVSKHYLDDQKNDVHHSQIDKLFNGTPEDRTKLALYCIKDAELPMDLLNNLMIFYKSFEMSRVTGVPTSFLYERGQSIKVKCQLYKRGNQMGFLIPHLKPTKSDESFQGATVLDPVRGFYKVPVATLDFASLYPSIMISNNLCLSTHIPKSDIHLYDKDDYVETPAGSFFMKEEKAQGVLPEILKNLLGARSKAKKDLAAATDPLMKSVLDGRQLALKVCANSVYGFTGASVEGLYKRDVSASVTAYGRKMIDKTKERVLTHYTKKNGYEHDSKVIYGDTV